MLQITCRCGERFHVEERHLGKSLKCRKCGRQQKVRRPSPSLGARLQRLAGSWRLLPTFFPSWRGRALAIPSYGGGRRVRQNPFSRWIPLLGLAYLVAVVLLAVTMWGFGDVALPGTLLLFLGRWIFLLPAAVLLPAAFVYPRTMLLPVLLAIGIVVGPIMGFRTGWRRLGPAPKGWAYRVVTYNTGNAAGIAFDLPKLVESWNGDLVALQECGDDLGAAVGALKGWHQHVSRDLCILSRYPIVEEKVMDRSALARVREDESAGVGGAGFVVRMAIETPKGPIGASALHLETPRKGLESIGSLNLTRLAQNTEIREIESKHARAFIDEGRVPMVILGDFNMPVESRIFRQYWGSFRNAFSVAGRGFGMTKFNGWIRARIDHVLVGPGWVVRDVSFGTESRSDHRPLIVDLVLPNR